MSNYWNNFFASYGPAIAKNEDDLFLQAGHTVNKRPISIEDFHRTVIRLQNSLALAPSDLLLDLCCGNGLFTAEMAAYAKSVIGVDFVAGSIATGKHWKPRINITYVVGDATAPISDLAGTAMPNKILMHHSLAYFKPEQLESILANILRHLGGRTFSFLCSNIPNSSLKSYFYNTPQRFETHVRNERFAPDTNDGLGRWWDRHEIEQICSQLGLSVTISDQLGDLANYRMDALISTVKGSGK